jgi:hypothetical protein
VTGLSTLDLQAGEGRAVLALGAEVRDRFAGADDPALRAELRVLSGRLPESLVRFLDGFRRTEPAGAAVVRGIPVDDAALGPTPQRFDPPDPTPLSLALDGCVMLVASVLGDVFGWAALQGGRMVHNVLPVPGHEQEKTGISSDSLLDLHTEDACHPARADYLILMCLRNDDGVPTAYARVDAAALGADAVAVLAQPRFVAVPEPDHASAFVEPLHVDVLFGHQADPYIRFDDYYVGAADGDTAGQAALRTLSARLAAAQVDVPLRPGDLLVVDNYRALHGRRPFQARYDGRDRWLKRVHITRDLRKSRPWRPDPATPVVGDAPA